MIILFVALTFMMTMMPQAKPTENPIQITTQEEIITAANARSDLLIIEACNRSNKPIDAYLLKIVALDNTGKQILRDMSQVTQLPNAPKPGFGPGAKLKHKRLIPKWITALPGVRFEVSADYVIFSDGSGYGPDTLQMSGYMRGKLDGMKSMIRIGKQKKDD